MIRKGMYLNKEKPLLSRDQVIRDRAIQVASVHMSGRRRSVTDCELLGLAYEIENYIKNGNKRNN